MEEVVSPENYRKALAAVLANQGAPGIDGMTTKELHGHLRQHWPKIQAKLRAGTYTPSPGRRVEIPKPNGGTRMLGIPTVLDRFIQQLFDHVNWDILMGKIAPVIRDKRVLRLIGKYLRAGAMVDGVVVKSVEGTPQGGPPGGGTRPKGGSEGCANSGYEGAC